MPRTTGQTQIAFDVPRDFKDRLAAHAIAENRSIRTVILRALSKYMGLPMADFEGKRGRPKKNPQPKTRKNP